MIAALENANRVFAVAGALRDVAIDAGVAREKVRVIGNGVDATRFSPIPRDAARTRLGISVDARVLISVGGLVERKGFHRVIEVLPELRKPFPGLRYVIVGGPSPEGDIGAELRQQVERLNLQGIVLFAGPVHPDDLAAYLSAADVFVLATQNEGWANVFLEAMACGLPIVTTDVGGNREVVCRIDLGTLVPFGDARALSAAMDEALRRDWDRDAIRAYALSNGWDARVTLLIEEFDALVQRRQSSSTKSVDA